MPLLFSHWQCSWCQFVVDTMKYPMKLPILIKTQPHTLGLSHLRWPILLSVECFSERIYFLTITFSLTTSCDETSGSILRPGL